MKMTTATRLTSRKGKVESPVLKVTDDQLARALLKINVGEYSFEELESNFSLTKKQAQVVEKAKNG
jgi:hypothetical protein